MRNVRAIEIHGDVAFVRLTQGYVAKIDAADAHLVEGRNWSALKSPRRKAIYACRVEKIDGKPVMILMHRHFLGLSGRWEQGDHRDGDGLNNRRYNLRACTHAENQINKRVRADSRCGLKGVSWESRSGRWRAEITLNGKKKWLGLFDSPQEAHEAYRREAPRVHGQFASLT